VQAVVMTQKIKNKLVANNNAHFDSVRLAA